jgi:hypothetical protein
LNLRPSGYEPDELPGCSTPRWFGIVEARYAVFLVRFGGDLLSHVLGRSTIGATALNCRVRDGIGCFARAVATKPEKKHHQLASRPAVAVCGFWSGSALPLPDRIKPVGRLVPVS